MLRPASPVCGLIVETSLSSDLGGIQIWKMGFDGERGVYLSDDGRCGDERSIGLLTDASSGRPCIEGFCKGVLGSGGQETSPSSMSESSLGVEGTVIDSILRCILRWGAARNRMGELRVYSSL